MEGVELGAQTPSRRRTRRVFRSKNFHQGKFFLIVEISGFFLITS